MSVSYYTLEVQYARLITEKSPAATRGEEKKKSHLSAEVLHLYLRMSNEHEVSVLSISIKD